MSSITVPKESLREASASAVQAKPRALSLDRVAFFTLLLLVPLVSLPYGTNDAWWVALMETAVFALAAVWLVDNWRDGAWLVPEHRLLLPLAALLVFAFIQTIPFGSVTTATGVATPQTISADPFETRRWIIEVGAYLLVTLLLLRYTSSPRRLRLLVYTIIATGVACSLLGILRQTAQRDAGFLIWMRLVRGVGYAQFINRNHFAFLMEMALGLLTGLIVAGGIKRERVIIFVAAALPLWAALVLTASRGGILTMFTQIVFIALMFGAVRPGDDHSSRSSSGGVAGALARLSRSFAFRATLVVCLLAMTLVGVMWIGGEQLAARLGTTPGEGLSASNAREIVRQGAMREQIWSATWELAKAHPFLGTGFNGYRVAITGHHDASGEASLQQAHNDYLELLAGGGVLACALVLWFFVWLIKIARRRLRSPDAFRRGACFGALVALFGAAVHSVVDFGLHTGVNALVCAALVAVAVANNNVEDRSALAPRKRRRRRSSSSLAHAPKVDALSVGGE
ncbi:MAG: O-antigen ligase family protein [Acidobacteriota bacterium]|nr:O-antigen ligase family protein [Acidobacteriota bacterium]